MNNINFNNIYPVFKHAYEQAYPHHSLFVIIGLVVLVIALVAIYKMVDRSFMALPLGAILIIAAAAILCVFVIQYSPVIFYGEKSITYGKVALQKECSIVHDAIKQTNIQKIPQNQFYYYGKTEKLYNSNCRN